MTPLHKWHTIIKTKDLARLKNLLAEDVTFHSPVVHTPQLGKAITFKYLAAAMQVLNNESFCYLNEYTNPTGAVLEFSCTLNGVHLNGVDIISFNEAGKITEFKVLVRPLKAVNMLHSLMGEMLLKGK